MKEDTLAVSRERKRDDHGVFLPQLLTTGFHGHDTANLFIPAMLASDPPLVSRIQFRTIPS